MSDEPSEFFREQMMKGRGVHRSEWDWVGCDFDYVIDNDASIIQLRQKIEYVLQQIK